MFSCGWLFVSFSLTVLLLQISPTPQVARLSLHAPLVTPQKSEWSHPKCAPSNSVNSSRRQPPVEEGSKLRCASAAGALSKRELVGELVGDRRHEDVENAHRREKLRRIHTQRLHKPRAHGVLVRQYQHCDNDGRATAPFAELS